MQHLRQEHLNIVIRLIEIDEEREKKREPLLIRKTEIETELGKAEMPKITKWKNGCIIN